MKKISIFLLLTIFIAVGCTDNNANDQKNIETNSGNATEAIWHTNLEKAIQIAKNKDKPILLQFSGSDWCKWCIKLNDEVLFKKEFTDYAKDNMILVNLDFPRSIPQTDELKAYNQGLLNKYGVRGFPTVLLLDKNGDVVLQTGYQPGGPAAYIQHIKQAYSKK